MTRQAFINDDVAPYAGAWIEIRTNCSVCNNSIVAPYAGAWIEMVSHCILYIPASSLLMQERGLKLRC